MKKCMQVKTSEKQVKEMAIEKTGKGYAQVSLAIHRIQSIWKNCVESCHPYQFPF